MGGLGARKTGDVRGAEKSMLATTGRWKDSRIALTGIQRTTLVLGYLDEEKGMVQLEERETSGGNSRDGTASLENGCGCGSGA